MKGKKLLLLPAIMLCSSSLSSCSVLCAVTWLNWDNTVLERDEHVFAFEFLSYDGETPKREADAQYTYEWTGEWEALNASKVFPKRALKRDTIYRATYNSTLRSYDVYFKDANGATLDHQVLNYGETPSFDYHYSTNIKYFDGWDKEIKPVTGNVTYTAVLKYHEYNVYFKDKNGATLNHQKLHYGDTPYFDYKYDSPYYVFTGWDKPITSVTGDATYTATYADRYYDVYFKDKDGTVLAHQELKYGVTPSYEYEYTSVSDVFTGWDKEIKPVTGNVTYTATYAPRPYLVTWMNYNGDILAKDSVNYGETPSYEGESYPSKPSDDDSYCWIFNGWDQEVVPVTGDVTYTAQYIQYYYKTFNLTYIVNDQEYIGPEVTTQVYEHADVALPTIIGEEYHDVSWYLTPELEKPVSEAKDIYDDMTFYGVDEGAHSFSISYNLNDGTVDGSNPTEVTYVDSIDLIDAEKEGYTFQGWLDEDHQVHESLENINHDLVLTADFTANTYRISFDCSDCDNSLEPIEVTYGEPFEELPQAEKEGYDFNFWHLATEESEFSSPYLVAGDVTLYPKFTVHEYAITYLECSEEDGVEINTENKETYTIENKDEFVLPTPEKEGYTFNGWQVVSPDLGDELIHSLEEVDGLLEDISIKPSWTPLPITVSFDFNGGTKAYSVNFYDDNYLLETFSVANGVNEVEYYVPEDKPNFQFAGWSEWPSDPNPISSDYNFYANWNQIGKTPSGDENFSIRIGEEKEYDLHNLNGCYLQFTPLVDQKVRISTTGELDLYINSEPVDAHGISQDGKNYWMEKEVVAGTAYVFRIAGASNEDGNTKVKLERIDGNTLVPEETIKAVLNNTLDPIVSEYDAVLTLPDIIPVKANYEFAGWFVGNKEYKTGDLIKEVEDFTLVAHWSVPANA